MRQVWLFFIGLIVPAFLYAGGSPTDEELRVRFNKLLDEIRRRINLEDFDSIVTGFDCADFATSNFERIQREALGRLAQGDFAAFDPLVGDTSCELRALMGLFLRDPSLLDETMRAWVTLVYILGHSIDAPRNIDGFNTHPQGGTNTIDLLNAFLKRFGTQLPKSMIMKLQQAVAAGSVIFARRQALCVSGEVCRDIQELFLEQCCLDADRPVVSCLGISHLLLERARRCRFPIVLRLRLAGDTTGPSLGTVTVAFVADAQGRFVATNPMALVDYWVVVVEGVTLRFNNEDNTPPTRAEVEAFIRELDFEETLRLDSALHPQFSGEKKRQALTDCGSNCIAREWEQTRGRFTDEFLARDRDGRITRNDPRVIRIDHVYPDTLINARRYNPFNREIERNFVRLRNAAYYPTQVAMVPAATRMATAMAAFAAALIGFANSGVRK